MENYFDVAGRWAPRQEDADGLARRLARYLVALGEIDPLFGQWTRDGLRHRSIVPRDITLPPSICELRAWLDENPVFEVRDDRKARVGYSIAAETRQIGEPNGCLWLRSRTADRPGFLAGQTGLSLLTPQSDPFSLRRGARRMLLALASALDVGWGGVATGDFSDLGDHPASPILKYKSGWMIYLDEEHASRIAEPEGVGVEAQPNGGVLLTAAEEIFDHSNKSHLGAARRIQAALAPLNAECRAPHQEIMNP